MPGPIRAKFHVQQLTQYAGSGAPAVQLQAVTGGQDASPEDTSFWNATPSGSINMHISNPNAAEFFQLGKRYYVTFEEAPDGS